MKKKLKLYNKNYKIKIIGGYLKNRKLTIPTNLNIKPTISRIRKTLFDWLYKKIKNAYCLDCYAGSGILGIESISNKAGYVFLLEKNYQTTLNIIKNTKPLNIKNINIINTDTIKWLTKSNFIFDIVFIDPPFYKNMINITIVLLEKYKHLSHKSFIYIEIEKKKTNIYKIPINWCLYKENTTGKIIYRIYIRYDI